jgi:hypothetical protein
MSSPLRAIILDNDEASGSYLILFDLWETLMDTSLGSVLTFKQILDFLIKKADAYNIFRPGLIEFLVTCVELRDTDRIDAIIMYTHQNAEFTWRHWSVPALLATLMGHLVAARHPMKRNLFDYVLTLPPEGFQKEINGWVVKKFDRVLNMYPWKPRDIREIVFIDDNASPKYIEADSIDSDKKHASSWYKVSPYRIAYSAIIYRQFINELCEEYSITLSEEDSVPINSIARGARAEKGRPVTYYPEDRTFLDLDMYVREKYHLRSRTNKDIYPL